MAIEIQVRNRRVRFGFDGQTGIVVVAKTVGTIMALTLESYPSQKIKRIPKLSICWHAAVVQDADNKDSSTYENWEESGVDPEDVEFVKVEEEQPAS